MTKQEMIDKLVADEAEAIDGYNEAIKLFPELKAVATKIIEEEVKHIYMLLGAQDD